MGRSVRQHGAMTGDEQLVPLHHTRLDATRTMRRIALVVSAASTLGLAVVAPAGVARPLASQPESSGDAVLVWNANAGEAALAACLAPTGNPLHESHMYAMAHVAIHDALNAIDRRYRPYAFFGHASRRARPMPPWRRPRETSWSRCSARSPHRSRRRASTRRSRAWKPTTRPRSTRSRTGRPKRKGINVGAKAAAAILALRADDGSDTPLVDIDLPAGRRARRVPVHARDPVRVRTRVGRRHPVRAGRQLPVPRRCARTT